MNEIITLKKWFLIISSFLSIVMVSYDPRFSQEIISLVFITLMAFFYALANILSRFLKDVNTIDQIGWHSFIGFFVLFLLSCLTEGNPLDQLYTLNYNGIVVAFHAGIFVSLIYHEGLFYLYKFYPVLILLPLYFFFLFLV